MIIGITGNSGTGKTSLCKAIVENINKTISIFDADKIAKDLAVPGKEYFKEIIMLFGKNILTDKGLINRKKLAYIIFSDKEKKKALDNITYKYVVEEIKRQISISKSEIIIIDAPLLIESKLNKICDIVISVIANKETKIKRICVRDKTDEETAKLRLSSQKNDTFYIKNSNYVVVNNDCNIKNQAKDIIKFINTNCHNKEIVIIQENNLKILQFKKLLKYKNLVHCFTLKPMDFGSNKTYQEIKNTVNDNYKKICSFLNLDYDNIVRAFQTHTKNVANLKNETGIFPNELTDIDGLITDKSNKVLSLVFADCTPIFLYDKEKQVIANIHSGWQGTLKMIAKEAVKKMIKTYKCNPEDIICTIGPTIRKCHFEVDEDVKNNFVKQFKNICKEAEFVIQGKNNQKYYIDTVYLNVKMLEQCGILKKNIIDSNICTVCNSKIMHSFRAEKEKSGRSTAIICKK